MSRFTLPLLVVVVSLLVGNAASSVELYYFEKQKAFRAVGTEDGAFSLEEVPDESVVSEYQGQRHDAWWVKGGLDMTPQYQRLAAGYRLKRIPETYRERTGIRRYEVTTFSNLVPPEAWEAAASKVLVFGWVHDGLLHDITVKPFGGEFTEFRELGITISEKEREGYLAFWIFNGEEFVRREDAEEWEKPILTGEKPDISVLKEMDPEGEWDALHYAALLGDLETARSLLEDEKKLVKVKSKKLLVTPLSLAVGAGRIEMVSLLLEYNASLSDGWEDLDSIVRKAGQLGHFDIVKLLVPEKVKGSEMKWHSSWAASDALNANYQDIALYLFDLGANVTLEKEARGAFALAKAQSGFPDMALALMEEFKIDPTYEKDGYNMMHAVATYGDVDLLERMESKGLGLKDVTAEGVSTLDFAVGFGNVDAICWLIDSGEFAEMSRVDLLKYAILNKQLSSVECLINYGYDVNSEPVEGVTQMMFAVYSGEREIAERLLEAGGVWLMDSPHLDYIASKAIEMDSRPLAEGLIGQGWEQERKVFGSFNLKTVASFYESGEVLNLLDSKGWDDMAADITKVGDVETKPKLVSPVSLDYPRDLQEKFGSVSMRTRMVLSRNGLPILARVEADEKEALVPIVQKAVYQLRFEPALKAGEPVPVEMIVDIPLNADYDPENVLSIAEVDEKPEAIRWVDPIYPLDLLVRKVRGQVVVGFILLETGEVVRPRIVESSHESFERSAILAVMQSSWKPATKGGKPVPCLVRVPIRFTR